MIQTDRDPQPTVEEQIEQLHGDVRPLWDRFRGHENGFVAFIDYEEAFVEKEIEYKGDRMISIETEIQEDSTIYPIQALDFDEFVRRIQTHDHYEFV